jgi:Tfp pilus assembly major pilin PilA
MKKTFKGFTLIELAIVVFSISVLTGIIVPNLQRYIIQAQKATDYANGALIYDSVSLVIASDDDAYYSFYNDNNGSRTAQRPDRVQKTYKKADGTTETVWVWQKKDGVPTTVVTRCSGVDVEQEAYLAHKMDMMYGREGSASGEWSGLHDPWYDSESNKGKGNADKSLQYTLYTWEPVGISGTAETKNNGMKRDVIRNKVKNGTDQGEYFTMCLSQKMDMPVWGDKEYHGSAVNMKKSYLTMRYTGGKTYVQGVHGKADISRDMYAWEWMITIDTDTYEPAIYRGNGQLNLIDRVYPSVDYNEALDW